ncbi:unnamed protein product [Paramecium pentaurelia]|uniref:Uncharacterized protein n=1 Tax=Paramecium pentaurelia TaxID=43138 RepID=A0A8S1YS91_9CILI|nr:unnamed protein product [Paramecium pentaurelia]
MKQGLFILLALIPIISAFDKASAYQQCPQDQTECMQEVFGCVSQEQGCHNECGETEQCFQQCYRIGNKKFIKFNVQRILKQNGWIKYSEAKSMYDRIFLTAS